MKNNNSGTDDLVKAGIAAVAASSKTPFRTAFKVALGIAAAQLVVGLLFLGAIGAIILLAAEVLGK